MGENPSQLILPGARARDRTRPRSGKPAREAQTQATSEPSGGRSDGSIVGHIGMGRENTGGRLCEALASESDEERMEDGMRIIWGVQDRVWQDDTTLLENEADPVQLTLPPNHHQSSQFNSCK